jgi:hypothetical protein
MPKKPTLDDFIAKKKKVPSKNKKGSVPPDYDVILPGMGYTKPTATKQPTRIKPKPKPTSRPGKPAPMPKGPKSPMETGVRSKPRKGNIKSKKK